jgi:membrane protein DedA with SNARE-associated domain
MFTDLINILANFVVATIDLLGYPGLFLLMFVESCGILMPSEVIMPFSGFLVADGGMNFWMVSLIGALGNLGGSLLAYWIGAKGGRPLIKKYGKYILISKHDLDIADRWFVKYGEWAAFFGRVLPVVRTFISFPAGISKMDIKKFSLYTFIGAFIWSATLAYAGVKMGENWELIRERMHAFDTAIGIIIIVFIIWYVARHIKRSKSEIRSTKSEKVS